MATPVLYLKQNCPFCLKVRIFLLEAGMEDVEVRDFAPGSAAETDIRGELEPQLAKVTFPTAQTEPGQFLTESDDIIIWLAERSGRDPANMTVLRNYLDGAFATMMRLFKENKELKAAA